MTDLHERMPAKWFNSYTHWQTTGQGKLWMAPTKRWHLRRRWYWHKWRTTPGVLGGGKK